MVILARHCPLTSFLRATRGARNPNLKVVIMHALHVCSQHSLGLLLRMNGMHKTQFDQGRFELLPCIIWSRMFQQSVKWNLYKSTVFEQKHLTAVITSFSHNKVKNCNGQKVNKLTIYTVVFKCGVGCTQGKGETNTARGQAGTWTWGLPTSKLQCFKINVSFMYHLLENHQTCLSRDDCLQESQ